MTLQEAIAGICRGEDLSRDQASAVMRILMSGDASAVQMAAFLTALHMKGESIDEIAGFAETMRQLATRIETSRRPLVDTCGTGGDHSGTFNISTTAAFVVAGAGVAVAKHGNRSATSKCGSADVLEQLGVNIDATPGQVGRCIDETGIGFLFARTLHGAMKHVAPVRAELGVRTVFNVLGPLTNPANADGQVMGVYDAALVTPIANVLSRLGVRHAYVVSGSDGLDEITLSGPTRVAEAKDGTVREFKIEPEAFGLSRIGKEALLGGDAPKNAEILSAVLEGAKGPQRDISVLNAAPAIVAGQKADTLEEGIQMACESIDIGAARAKLDALVDCSKR